MLNPQRFAQLGVAALQRNTQWCWAACIEMVCRWHGISISQSSIVNRVYGGFANMPADDRVLTSALNSKWTADDGRKFQIKASVFSPVLQQYDVSNTRVVNDIKSERPLINGSRTHATVTARVDYLQPVVGQPQVTRVHVIDPWPGAAPPPQHARFLAPDEMVPIGLGGSLRYLASIDII